MNRLQPPLHLLKAFLATARFGSVSRACESLHLTQSAVSKQVSELEQITGVLLFERIRRRLTLTPPASVMKRHCGRCWRNWRRQPSTSSPAATVAAHCICPPCPRSGPSG